ncbi:hypothetical protein BaRGS_00024773 [Batillaria attramentaria]|uniref:Aquaporin n=1 Tax=Batillaria attramentaria TaxID=370345 RepID=A0ABD0KAD0_9CAEN
MRLRDALRIKSPIVREMLAEFIGTFILVTFAVASGAQYVLSRGELSSFLTVNFAGGMGLMFGVYWAGGVSGASLNPSVTLALCLHGVIEWWKYPHYVLSEMLGAFTAAAVQFGVFYDGIRKFDGGVRQTYGPNATAGIFSTFPREEISTLNCFFDQVFGTFILISSILAITDKNNMRPDKGLLPIALGSIVFAIGTYRDYNWFWVPIAGPLTGAVVSWCLYNLFIQLHWPPTRGEELGRVTGDDITVNGDLDSKDSKGGLENPAFSGSNGQSALTLDIIFFRNCTACMH